VAVAAVVAVLWQWFRAVIAAVAAAWKQRNGGSGSTAVAAAVAAVVVAARQRDIGSLVAALAVAAAAALRRLGNDDDHQRLQWPWEAQCRRTMETEHHRDRAAMGMARQNVLSAPSPARCWPTSFVGGGMQLGNAVFLRRC
jgi:hypothetical protein